MPDLVEAGRFNSVMEAGTAVASLASEGIDASIVTDNAGGAFPSLSSLGGGVRVLVRERDAHQAHIILSGVDDEDTPPSS